VNKEKPESAEKKIDTRLVEKALKTNPYHRFSDAFALMAVIPFLVFFYLITTWLSSFDILSGRIGLVLALSIFVSLSGYLLGFKVLREMVGITARSMSRDRSKSNMMATVSHDLKNPLTVLSVNIEEMLHGSYGPMGEDQKRILKFCRRILERMYDLIEDMIDLYKTESESGKAKRKLCDLSAIINKQAEELEALMKKKHIHLVKKELNEEIKIWADENKIAQVVNNLLGNAVKYAPERGEIDVRLIPEKESIRMEFVDNGNSIPPEKLETIFNKFERANVTDKENEGEGLGLAITKDIVELHAGRIWAESQPDVGNKFVVILPRDLRSDQDPAA
jgi:signal transduction histidine kinase